MCRPISIHPSYHLRERRLHSRMVAKRKERAERRGCPRLRRAGARTLPAQIVAVGKPPPTSPSPVTRGKSLRNQNTLASSTSRQTRGDRRRYKTDSLARSSRECTILALICTANACKSRVFFFFFSSVLFFLSFSRHRISWKHPRAQIVPQKEDRRPRIRRIKLSGETEKVS